MKRFLSFLGLLLVLTGCHLPGTQTIIDWVDFIKWDDQEYMGIDTGVLADEKWLGNRVGEVKFKVADNVNNPSYKTKNGDAGFLEKGTTLYAVKGHPELLAVKSTDDSKGYRLYDANESTKYSWHFKDMPQDEVKKVGLYELYTEKGTIQLAEFAAPEEINRLLTLLNESKENIDFQPNTLESDPTYYEMVFYCEGPVAYKFSFQFDGETYFWYPWETNILSNEIGDFFGIANETGLESSAHNE